MDTSEMKSGDQSIDETKPVFDLSTSKLTTEDAIKCLTGEYHVLIPTPNAKPCKDLDEYLYRSTLKAKKVPKKKADENSSRRTSKRMSLPRSEPFSVPLVRNFEKILKKSIDDPQEDYPSPPRKKVKQDTSKETEHVQVTSGPLSLLKGRMNQVVKVVIRRRQKIPCISRVVEYKGTLTKFDKHMNIHLRDVVESISFEKDGKTLKHDEHLDSIMIRGDNVILVA